MKQNFIKTKDKETSEELIREGFQLLSFDNGIYTFLNCQNLTFENKEKKCVYSNKLSV